MTDRAQMLADIRKLDDIRMSEITRLRAERDEARDALRDLIDAALQPATHANVVRMAETMNRARAALGGTPTP